MKIEFVKIGNEFFHPQKVGEKDPESKLGFDLPACIIKEKFFGFIQIDYYDEFSPKKLNSSFGDQTPNARILIHKSKIDFIKYRL